MNKRAVWIVVIVVTIIACNNNTSSGVDIKNHAESNTITAYTFEVEDGFGYAVFIDGKEFIHQDCIPVIQGNKPFLSRQQAKQTAALVVQKMRAKELPSLTLEELNKLGITQQ